MHAAQPQARQRDLLLTKRDEEIIRAIATHRVMSAEQIARLLFSPSSLTYVRERLHRLCGGRDFAPRSYLVRLPQPTSTPGAKPRLYRVGVLGVRLLASQGIPVSGAYRPSQQYSYSHIAHALTLTDVVICARQTPGYRLAELLLCYDIARDPPIVETPPEEEPDYKMLTDGKDEKPLTVAVIPDAFAVFERERDGQLFPMLIEVDRATMPKDRIKHALRARLRLLASPIYRQWSGKQSARILYLTDGETEDSSDARRRALGRWIAEVLAEEQKEAWADLFRAASLKDCEDLYKPPLFSSAIWYSLGNADPGPLLTP